MTLLNYSHHRDDSFKKTSLDLFKQIETFADQPSLSPVYRYFRRRFHLPDNVVKQKMKRHLSALYAYRKGAFDSNLKLMNVLRSFCIHTGFLIFCLLFSRKARLPRKFRLIVDGIINPVELERFSKLIELVKRRNSLVVTTNAKNPALFPGLNFYLLKRYHAYERKTVWKTVTNELRLGIWLHLYASFKTGVNLFPLVSAAVNDYMMYTTIFRAHKADFLIQERHYNTSSIKNHLFKKLGGKAATCFQKNLLSMEQISYYYDMDCFFALGTETATRAFTYGGRIDRVIPVGSLFMEHYWFSRGNQATVKKKYDVVMLGINTSNAMSRLDAYRSFVRDYYDTIRWLVQFKQTYPDREIAIVHHVSAGIDEVENELVKGTGIQQLDKRLNSYEVAFKSKTAVSFGSTMGYELNAHGLPTLFLDPGARCQILPDPDENLVEPIRMKTYTEMETVLNQLLQGQDALVDLRTEKLCLNSERVSEQIVNHMNIGLNQHNAQSAEC